jgi:glucose/arabinose dehydrogenase
MLALLAVLGGCGGDGKGGGRDNDDPPPVADTTAPSVPQSLAATAQSATQVQLTWTESTDTGTGVAGYRVYRDGAAAPVASVTSGTSYTDTGLTAQTQYSYTVSAFDAANPTNESAQSTAVTVTTPQATGQLKLSTQRAFPDLPAFQSPVFALQAPGDGSTWYVVEQAGRVMAFDDDNAVSAKRVFVNLTSVVQSGGERGLLGMTFHPEYPTTPRVFLSYTTSVSGQLVSRISSFETRDAGASLDPDSETILLSVAQPAANHNGGHLAFGPDGLLYIGLGDGGGAGDPWGTIGNGQDLTTLLGKVLRIDVSGTSGAVNYLVPEGNPYAANAACNAGAGSQSCPEIFAYGFRNPWRFSFDRVDGDLWVGDVGENSREEINRVVVGGNYGWRCVEGTLPHSDTCGPNAGVALAPIAQYTHDIGGSVTGGYVYRGQDMDSMKGRYLFGDFINGRVWHIARDREPTRDMTAAAASETELAIASFAEDHEGELYVVDYGGTLHRVLLSTT